ncbi:MAG: type II secretion system F family protein [Gammaproteobacteria bacterium]|jgi:tight adherence protein C
MEAVLNTVANWVLSPDNQQLLFLLMVGGTIALLAMGLSSIFMGATNPIKKRMGVATGVRAEEDSTEVGRRLVDIPTIMGPISEWLIPSSEVELNDTTRKLTYAGFRAPNALETFYGIKAIATIAFAALALFGTRFMPDLSTTKVLWIVLGAAAAGIFGPGMILDKLSAMRIKKLRDGFPDALDLLVVCVESGLGLAAAIQRVSVEIGVSHSELATELALVNAEMRAGVDRAKALRNFADRSGLDDIRGLVSMLIQAMRFGTSIAETLRVYSEEFRDRRMQKAEEEAAKIGTKLVFPLIFCLFPSFFTVAIGPAVIGFIEVFRQL